MERGFSLLELMIAVAVMAILTLIAYPSYNSYMASAKRAEAKAAAQVVDRDDRAAQGIGYPVRGKKARDVHQCGFGQAGLRSRVTKANPGMRPSAG